MFFKLHTSVGSTVIRLAINYSANKTVGDA